MSKPKILYVDDEQINITTFTLSFEEQYDILPAYSGREALALFAEHPDIAMVVADQRMPGMSGVELLTTIYKMNPDPMRIILTAFSDFADIIEAVNQGHIYQYIQKPWFHEEVSQILTRALSQFTLIKENKFLLTEMEDKNNQLHQANIQLAEELKIKEDLEQKRRAIEVKMLSQAKLASLGEIATGIAHEINQPLTFIQVMMEAAERDIHSHSLDEDELLEDVVECRKQIRRISQIIDHLRTFGREDSTTFAELNLPDILENALILFNKKIQVNNITLVKKITKKLPLIKGNPTQLEQVFINLIQNSIDALHDTKEPAIDITFHPKGNNLLISFKDNGCGTPDHICSKIFEPFFTTKDTGKGIGLGLSITYGIINNHGGTIECVPTSDKGTEFLITLPISSR